MEHVVFYTEKPGEPEFRRVGDLEEAVRLVEILRNERGIADVSVHALTPVPVSFRTYYRVEVSGVDVQPVEAPAVEPVAEHVAVHPADEAPELADEFEVPSLVDDAPPVPSLALLPP